MVRNEETKMRNGARLFFALIILFATLLAAASGVSFAKSISSSSGGDSAQVSVPIIDIRGSSSDNLTIDYGQGITTAEYNFTVTNKKDGKTAETSFRYDVIVTFTETLPEGVSITVDGKVGAASSDRKKVTVKDVGVFAAGISQTNDHILVFSVVNESFLMKDYVFANTSVSVRAEQVC